MAKPNLFVTILILFLTNCILIKADTLIKENFLIKKNKTEINKYEEKGLNPLDSINLLEVEDSFMNILDVTTDITTERETTVSQTEYTVTTSQTVSPSDLTGVTELSSTQKLDEITESSSTEKTDTSESEITVSSTGETGSSEITESSSTGETDSSEITVSSSTGETDSSEITESSPTGETDSSEITESSPTGETDSSEITESSPTGETDSSEITESNPTGETDSSEITESSPTEETGPPEITESSPPEETGPSEITDSSPPEETGPPEITDSSPPEETGPPEITESSPPEETGPSEITESSPTEETSETSDSGPITNATTKPTSKPTEPIDEPTTQLPDEIIEDLNPDDPSDHWEIEQDHVKEFSAIKGECNYTGEIEEPEEATPKYILPCGNTSTNIVYEYSDYVVTMVEITFYRAGEGGSIFIGEDGSNNGFFKNIELNIVNPGEPGKWTKSNFSFYEPLKKLSVKLSRANPANDIAIVQAITVHAALPDSLPPRTAPTSTTTAPPTTTEKDSNLALILGLSIPLGILLLIVIIGASFFIYKRQQKRRKGYTKKDDFEDSQSGEFNYRQNENERIWRRDPEFTTTGHVNKPTPPPTTPRRSSSSPHRASGYFNENYKEEIPARRHSRPQSQSSGYPSRQLGTNTPNYDAYNTNPDPIRQQTPSQSSSFVLPRAKPNSSNYRF